MFKSSKDAHAKYLLYKITQKEQSMTIAYSPLKCIDYMVLPLHKKTLLKHKLQIHPEATRFSLDSSQSENHKSLICSCMASLVISEVLGDSGALRSTSFVVIIHYYAVSA